MSILTQTTQPVNTRYWSGAATFQVGDTYLVIDKHTGFLTLLRQGEETNVVGTLAIAELRKALGLHSLGFATPTEQSEDRQTTIVAMAKDATSKQAFDAALSVAYEYDAMLMTNLRRTYESKWY